MRKGTQKYAYNRAAFGQFVADRRQVLGWSIRELRNHVYERTTILLNPGTLHRVERGEGSLPEPQREALRAVLDYPDGEDGIEDCLRVVEVSPSSALAPMMDDPQTLKGLEDWNWGPAKEGWLRLASLARARQQWGDWADYTRRAGKMLMMLGRYEESAAVLDTVLDADSHLIGQEALGETLLNRGWLAMAWRDFRTATYYLRQSDQVASRMGVNRGQALHFLGRTYCEWGIAEDSDTYRETGRRLLASAYVLDKQLGDNALQGYDLLHAESLELLEEISAQVYISWCDSVVRRHAAFWEDQLANIYQMDTPPFDLLRTLTARPDGAAYIQRALDRAQAAIRAGLPEYLTRREQETLTHCLLIAHVR